jgi:hypothetical protein
VAQIVNIVMTTADISTASVRQAMSSGGSSGTELIRVHMYVVLHDGMQDYVLVTTSAEVPQVNWRTESTCSPKRLLIEMADPPSSAISNRNPPLKIGTYRWTTTNQNLKFLSFMTWR